MPSDLHTHDLIMRMKAIKEEQHLSPQDISRMLDAAGYHVSENSIRKVFADGSENKTFRFHDTLQPISRVLFGIYGNETEDSEVEGLKAAIRVKDELIEKLERLLAEQKSSASRGNTFLMEQIRLKDERIDRLMSRVDEVLSSNRELTQQLQKLLDKCDSCPVKRITEDQTP